MGEVNNNLEQLDFFNESSQGEEILQEENGVEDCGREIGSKFKEEEKDSKPFAMELKEDNFENSKVEEVKADNLKADENLLEENLFDLTNSKFKSVKDLSKAYDNLQSSYTKKCQILADLQKQIEDNKEKSLPLNDGKSLISGIEEFLSQNSDAKDYIEDLTKMILTDNQFATSNNPLEDAWRIYRQKNFYSKKSLLEDEDFINSYILNNKEIREKIVKDYFSSINLQSTPNLITSNNVSYAVVATPQKPKSIEEASKLVKDML